MEPRFAHVGDNAVGRVHQFVVVVEHPGGLHREVIVEAREPGGVGRERAVERKAPAHVLVFIRHVHLRHLRVGAARIDVRIEGAAHVERERAELVGVARRGRDALIAHVAAARVGVRRRIVDAEVGSAPAAEGKALAARDELGERVGLGLELPRCGARLGLHHDDARREVAILHRRDAAYHLDALNVVGAHGAQVGAAAGGGLVAHAVDRGARRRAVAPRGQGLQVGVVRERRAVHHDGRAQRVVGVGVYFAYLGLRQRAQVGVGGEATRHELQQVGQALGLDVAYGLLPDGRRGALAALRGHDGHVFQLQVHLAQRHVEPLAARVQRNLPGARFVAQIGHAPGVRARPQAADAERAVVVGLRAERLVELHRGQPHGPAVGRPDRAAQRQRLARSDGGEQRGEQEQQETVEEIVSLQGVNWFVKDKRRAGCSEPRRAAFSPGAKLRPPAGPGNT